MTRDRQLQQAILAELHHSNSQLAACIVVTVVDDEVLLSRKPDTFADKRVAAAVNGKARGVGRVADGLLEMLPLCFFSTSHVSR
jgi:osmotically-inducible protein OsmY